MLGGQLCPSTVIEGNVYSQAELSDQSFSAVAAWVDLGLQPLWCRVEVLPMGCFVCSQTRCSRVLGRALIPEVQSHHVESKSWIHIVQKYILASAYRVKYWPVSEGLA